MLHNIQNGCLKIDDTDMDYITFGNGKKILVMIPGLGDGLTTVKGMAVPFSFVYRAFGKAHKVYVFSRKNKLKKGYTTKDMAEDLWLAMKKLGIEKAHVLGISQGGMIAQHFAIDYPEMVERLVLCVTIARQNQTIQRVVSHWHELAQRGRYREIMKDTAEKMYVKYNEKLYACILPIIEKICAPKSFERFKIQAKACLSHNAYDEIERIKACTLVIGASKDQVLEGRSSVEIARKIPNSRLIMFRNHGHGVYEESKKFNRVVLEFLNE